MGSRVKIICTLGPACDDRKVLKDMISNGMSIARLNFSHGNHEEHKKRIDVVRELNKVTKNDVRVLQDLEGYRIRVRKLPRGVKKGIVLKKGQEVLLSNRAVSKGLIIPFDYKGALTDIKVGSFIYIDDGNIALRVDKSSQRYIRAEVIVPGTILENKGINIPDMRVGYEGMTDKDRRDLLFGVKNQVDLVAQSFVRDRDDILIIRDFLKHQDHDCGLIAKIENKDGIKNIDRILDVADGIMIARGDMGVSLPIYEVPMLQKMIIKKCRERHKMAVTATQMLESMTENIRPTRAEVSDVANTVLDGTDYVMLSAETAIGKYPVETVRMMSQIIEFTEGHDAFGVRPNQFGGR